MSAPATPPTTQPMPIEQLTPRETEAAYLLACGYSNDEIAHAMDISPYTAKFYVNALLTKTHTDRRTAAVMALLKADVLQLALINPTYATEESRELKAMNKKARMRDEAA